MRFDDLGLISPILRALKDKNYTSPTAIQEKAIPLILKRNDILGSAQTGTGKTAAFAIPIIQLIQKNEGDHRGRPKLRSLIVTPTRELAIQIDENIKAYSKYTKLKHTVIFGGVKQGKQVAKLREGVHILIATPGRLLDLQSQGEINLNSIKMFVLDEADRMLDMGFINDIKKLLTLLPEKRQSLFFSATMPSNILNLSKKILKNPKKVQVNQTSSAAETINQYIYYTDKSKKKKLLLHILDDKSIDQVLLFARTKHGADRISGDLRKRKIKASAIHGNKAQNQRQKALKLFKSKDIRVLVATDIAARGIDVDKLKYVINYDIPNVSETYVHRIGRAGRAGEEGIAISICEPEENAFVKDIEKLIDQEIRVIEENPFPQTEKPMTDKEKKEWMKEKQRRKQEFFTNRKKNLGNKPKSKPKKVKSKKSEYTRSEFSKSGTSKPKRKFNNNKKKRY